MHLHDIVTSLVHVSAQKCHLQGVHTKFNIVSYNKPGYIYGISQLSVHSVANLSKWIKYVNFPVYCRHYAYAMP